MYRWKYEYKYVKHEHKYVNIIHGPAALSAWYYTAAAGGSAGMRPERKSCIKIPEYWAPFMSGTYEIYNPMNIFRSAPEIWCGKSDIML